MRFLDKIAIIDIEQSRLGRTFSNALKIKGKTAMTSKKLFKITRLALLVGVLLTFAARASLAQDSEKNQTPSDLQIFSTLTGGLSDLLNAPQKEKRDSDASDVEFSKRSGVKAPLPVPREVGVLLKTPSLRALDAGLSVFFKRTSDVEFSALSALRLTSFAPVLRQIDPDAPAAITLFCETRPPKAALVLPVAQERFARFVDALNKTVPESERQAPNVDKGRKTAKTSVTLEETIETTIRQIDANYVALVLESDSQLLERFAPDVLRGADEKELAPGLKDAFLSLELTPRGAFFLTAPDRPIWSEFENLTIQLQNFAPDYPIKENLAQLRATLRSNLGAARIDLAVDDARVYLSTQKAPKAGSTAFKRVASYPRLSPFDPTVDRYFAVLPYKRGAIAGQTEIAPTTAATLEPPYNRLRYVEYSLALPEKNELAAESWLFFLEVDDSQKFVEEAILPNAREIGSYVGAREAEEIGAEIFGAMAARRRDRQLSRRRQPARLADPNEAAARGAALGALIGASIGESSGEKSAMKEYPIDGYTAYVSDLETFARQKALMNAEKAGVSTPRPSGMLIDPNRPLLSAVGGLLANVDGGEDALQRAMLQSANARSELIDDAPLLARTGYWVVLDKQRLLFGLGNVNLLRTAINNWNASTKPSVRYLSFDSDASAVDSLKGLCAKTPNLQDVQAVGTIRLDLSAAQEYYRWFLTNYLRDQSRPQFKPLPRRGTDALIASSVGGTNEKIDVAAPFATVKNVAATFADGATPLQLLITPKNEKADDTKEEEFEVDFDDK